MDRSKVAIVIPAYNESKTVGEVVKQALIYGEVIVIDDYSSDNTGVIAKNYGANVIYNENNLGYEQSLNAGFKKANDLCSEIIITVDADGQHNLNSIQQILDSFKYKSVDMVLGIRNEKNRSVESLFGFYSKIRFRIKDPLCGMKGYKLKLYQKYGYFDKSRLIGTELMFNSVDDGMKFCQIDIDVSKRKDKSRYGVGLKTHLKIIKTLFICIKKYGIY